MSSTTPDTLEMARVIGVMHENDEGPILQYRAGTHVTPSRTSRRQYIRSTTVHPQHLKRVCIDCAAAHASMTAVQPETHGVSSPWRNQAEQGDSLPKSTTCGMSASTRCRIQVQNQRNGHSSKNRPGSTKQQQPAIKRT